MAGDYFLSSHVLSKETEAQRGEVTGLKSSSGVEGERREKGGGRSEKRKGEERRSHLRIQSAPRMPELIWRQRTLMPSLEPPGSSHT